MTRKQWMPIYSNLVTGKQKIDYIVTNNGNKYPARWIINGRFKTFKTHYWVGLTENCIRMNCSTKTKENREIYDKLVRRGLPIEEIKFIKLC